MHTDLHAGLRSDLLHHHVSNNCDLPHLQLCAPCGLPRCLRELLREVHSVSQDREDLSPRPCHDLLDRRDLRSSVLLSDRGNLLSTGDHLLCSADAILFDSAASLSSRTVRAVAKCIVSIPPVLMSSKTA
jgi:hypothetical protein